MSLPTDKIIDLAGQVAGLQDLLYKEGIFDVSQNRVQMTWESFLKRFPLPKKLTPRGGDREDFPYQLETTVKGTHFIALIDSTVAKLLMPLPTEMYLPYGLIQRIHDEDWEERNKVAGLEDV